MDVVQNATRQIAYPRISEEHSVVLKTEFGLLVDETDAPTPRRREGLGWRLLNLLATPLLVRFR